MNESNAVKTKVIFAYFKSSKDFILVPAKTIPGIEVDHELPVTDSVVRRSFSFVGTSASSQLKDNPFGVVAEVSVSGDTLELVRLGNDYPKYRVMRDYSCEGNPEKKERRVFFEGNFLELSATFPRDPNGLRRSQVDQIAPEYVSANGEIILNSLEIRHTVKSDWMSFSEDPRPNPVRQASILELQKAAMPLRPAVTRRVRQSRLEHAFA